MSNQDHTHDDEDSTLQAVDIDTELPPVRVTDSESSDDTDLVRSAATVRRQ